MVLVAPSFGLAPRDVPILAYDQENATMFSHQ